MSLDADRKALRLEGFLVLEGGGDGLARGDKAALWRVLRLGAGHSQVQILSPRWHESPAQASFFYDVILDKPTPV